MNDLVTKLDRLREILGRNLAPTSEELADPAKAEEAAELVEVILIGVDLIGEVAANSRRIAVALERMADDLDSIRAGEATILIQNGV